MSAENSNIKARSANTAGFHSLLVAYDSSEPSEAALQYAIEVAVQYKSVITLAYVESSLEYAADLEGGYLDNRIALEQVIDGGDRVAMIGRTHGSVRETNQTFDIPVMHLWTFQDQTAMRLEIVVDVLAMQVALQIPA